MGEYWERFKDYLRGTDDLSVLERHRDSFKRLGDSVLKAAERNEALTDQAGNRAYDLGQANFRIRPPADFPATQLELKTESLDDEIN